MGCSKNGPKVTHLAQWSASLEYAVPDHNQKEVRTSTTQTRPAWKNPEASNCFRRELPSCESAAQESRAISPRSSHLLSSGILKLPALCINRANSSQVINSICHRKKIQGVLRYFSWLLVSAAIWQQAPLYQAAPYSSTAHKRAFLRSYWMQK